VLKLPQALLAKEERWVIFSQNTPNTVAG